MKSYFQYLFIVLILVSGFSCKKDNTPPSTVIPQPDEINQFIWSTMHDFYLWQANVPNLTNSQYSKTDSLNAFLNKFTDHEKLFENLLYKRDTVDKWSWIVDDYTALENSFQGITKTPGYDFRLGEFTGTTTLFGYIRYVIKGSPAEKAGLKRGDIFLKVNGQEITEANYMNLLFDKDSYTLSLASISNNYITLNGSVITVNAEEVHENPIYLDTVYSINSAKVGYLVYNGFMSDYDIQLNNVFKKFKDAGISKLILDFRYNPGGSVQSAVYLASMIYGTSTSNIFLKTQYNSVLQDYLKTTYGENYFNQSFANVIAKTTSTPETPINTIGLSDLYVITTGSTASASELIINGLKAYIPVSTIGTNTVGKYVASMTLKDYDSKGNLVTTHKWALQPIVLKISNKNGVSDFVNGFSPTVEVKESLSQLLPFGDLKEPFLAAALNLAVGMSIKQYQVKSANIDFRVIADSKDFNPHSKEMYVNAPNLKKVNR